MGTCSKIDRRCYNNYVISMENISKNKSFWFLCLGGFIVFATMLLMIKTSNIESFDNFFGTIFVRSETMTNIMRGITLLAEAGSLILFAVLFAIFVKDKRDGASTLFGLGICAGINSVLKKLIRRPRPSIEHLVVADGFSFPSGHSASSMAFYGLLIYWIWKNCKNVMLRNVLVAFLGFIILAIGVSRIYLGVHYPSDVIGGFSFAIFYLSIYIKCSEKIWAKK